MRPSTLLLAPALLAAAAPLETITDGLPYSVPALLLQELKQFAASDKTVAAADASSSSSDAASCIYPARYTISHFTTWAPTNSDVPPYVAFHYTDADTGINTACARNESSVSLNDRAAATGNAAATGLALRAGIAIRFPCDDPNVAFVWQPLHTADAPGGTLTLIETACPGRTTTVFEAAGSVRPPAAGSTSSLTTSPLLRCVAIRGAVPPTSSGATLADDAPFRDELGVAGNGILCWDTRTFGGNFTSLQPSPL